MELPRVFSRTLSNKSCLRTYVYGKGEVGGTPKEIRIDVENPSATGDYYYAPLIWNTKVKMYLMKDTEEISGRRPR
jgi:hypothetical protein